MNLITSNKDIREKIIELELLMKIAVTETKSLSISECPLKHTFAPGAYAREIFIPKETLIVGKIHKHSHLNMLMKGTVSVLTEEGPRVFKAPMTMVSPAGTKRVVFAHEDTVWVTVHLTNETDLEKIEEEIIAKSYEEFQEFIGLEQRNILS
jgi:hypothetical protein